MENDNSYTNHLKKRRTTNSKKSKGRKWMWSYKIQRKRMQHRVQGTHCIYKWGTDSVTWWSYKQKHSNTKWRYIKSEMEQTLNIETGTKNNEVRYTKGKATRSPTETHSDCPLLNEPFAHYIFTETKSVFYSHHQVIQHLAVSRALWVDITSSIFLFLDEFICGKIHKLQET